MNGHRTAEVGEASFLSVQVPPYLRPRFFNVPRLFLPGQPPVRRAPATLSHAHPAATQTRPDLWTERLQCQSVLDLAGLKSAMRLSNVSNRNLHALVSPLPDTPREPTQSAYILLVPPQRLGCL
jgi:hypothetical protein